MKYLPTIYLLLAALLLSLAPLSAAPPRAQPPAPMLHKTLHPGESDVYEFDGMTAAAVGSPLVADIVPLTARRLLVNARAVGETTLFVYDKRGKHTLRLVVTALPADLGPLAARVRADIGLPDVRVRAVGNTLLLEGSVLNALESQRAQTIAGVYSPNVRNLVQVAPPPVGLLKPSVAQTYADLLTAPLASVGVAVRVVDTGTIALSGDYRPAISSPTGPADATLAGNAPRQSASAATDPLARLLETLPPDLRVINLVNLGRRPTRQILVRAKVIDINRAASKTLGVRWGTLNGAASRGGGTYTFTPQPILFGQDGGQGPTVAGYSLGAGGPIQRLLPLAAQLDALVEENKARVLSEPSLLVLDGSDGSILVGGEIPVPVAQSSTGTSGVSASVTVVYKPYGVRLLVHVDLVEGGKIQMTVTPEVSDLNYTNAVQLSGFVIPALTVRRATSTLQMGDGETLVIGGLYSSTASRQTERVPLLSQIPVLGEFFKSTTTRKQESELLILIQPQIVTPDTPGVQPPPSGSLENLPIPRPDVRRGAFDKDFPALQKGGGDRDAPRGPEALP